MPSENFGTRAPDIFFSYVEAFRLKIERRRSSSPNSTDYQAWLTGAYCENAFSVVLSNAFGKKGGVKAKYPKEPISFGKNRAEKEADDEKKLLALCRIPSYTKLSIPEIWRQTIDNIVCLLYYKELSRGRKSNIIQNIR